jgi:predicted Na+-dependent transporter
MAVLFTIVLSALGWAVARLTTTTLGKPQRSAILFGFPARNLGLAALLAANVFGIIEMAIFGVVVFVLQIFFLLPLAVAVRHKGQLS